MDEIPGMVERIGRAIAGLRRGDYENDFALFDAEACAILVAHEVALIDAGMVIVPVKDLADAVEWVTPLVAAAHRCSTTNPEVTSPVGGTEALIESARRVISSLTPGTLLGSELNLALHLRDRDGDIWEPWCVPGEIEFEDDDGFQCPACRWHEGEEPAEWFAEEAKIRGFSIPQNSSAHRLHHRPAYFTYDSSHGERGPAYYFAPNDRSSPPYLEQRHVTAILDVASDGTLAGVELVYGELPAPPNWETMGRDIAGRYPETFGELAKPPNVDRTPGSTSNTDETNK